MRDISLHMLDLVQNSISAGASLVTIRFELDQEGWLTFTLIDDGKGMEPEFVEAVTSPFTTTRTTRKVGLGIPMLAANCRLTGGDVRIISKVGEGTTLEGKFNTKSIDCLPVGDLAGTMLSLIITNPETPDFCLEVITPKGEAGFDTRMVREALGGLPLNEPEIVSWMKESLDEEIQPIFGGNENEKFS